MDKQTAKQIVRFLGITVTMLTVNGVLWDKVWVPWIDDVVS